MLRPILLVLVSLFVATSTALAQEPTVPFVDTSGAAMAKLAADVLAVCRDEDRDRDLNTRFRLQMVAGRHADAVASIRALRELRSGGDPSRTASLFVHYEIVASARERASGGQMPFDDAFAEAFRELAGRLDDRAAYQLAFALGTNTARFEADLAAATGKHRGRTSLPLADAIELVRAFQVCDAFRELSRLSPPQLAADDARRYVIDRGVLVATSDGAQIAAMVYRPRVDAKQATLLEFTIYAVDEWAMNDAKKCAAYGYAGVVAYTRGKGRSPGPVVPYERDGDDARAVIEWIARQPWSDGRVGMYGGSYNSFAQWAAAKKLPKALKCLQTSASAAPGIDVPMQGNIFMNFLYPWVPYVTNVKALDDATYGDRARWEKLNRSWYESGRAYRDLDQIDGTPNPVFRRWLDHPGYDAFWQAMVPYRNEFATIDIPVLSTSGYFDGALVGALYYFTEHTRHLPRANHTLVIGPFEHFTMQNGVSRNVQGYDVDPVATIDLQELRFAWFDHVLKGAPKPELLKDRVNYQVMGANVWKHAPTLEGMERARRRLFLVEERGAATKRLAERQGPAGEGVPQTVDFAERRDSDYESAVLSVTKTLDTHNGIAFASEPLKEATEISGVFSGQFDFVVNKKDFDVTVTLYEQLPTGEYFQLAFHMGRASYAKDRNRRSLLTPNRPQQLAFRSERMTSRLVQPGSRIVVVVTINRQPDLQINYGTGRDVSAETIADAKVPLSIRWLPSSWIELPIGK